MSHLLYYHTQKKKTTFFISTAATTVIVVVVVVVVVEVIHLREKRPQQEFRPGTGLQTLHSLQKIRRTRF